MAARAPARGQPVKTSQSSSDKPCDVENYDKIDSGRFIYIAFRGIEVLGFFYEDTKTRIKMGGYNSHR